MKNKLVIFYVWILTFSFLFYQQNWGLNALIFCIVSVAYFGFEKYKTQGGNLKTALLTGAFFPTAITWLISAVGMFLMGEIPQGILFVISGLTFFAARDQKDVTLVFQWLQLSWSTTTGFIRYFADRTDYFKDQQSGHIKQLVRLSIVVFGTLLILIIFLKLYQAADVDFKELTAFINLDWISWGFIFFTFFMSLLAYGSFFKVELSFFSKLDKALSNEISPTYKDKIQQFFGLNFERNTANYIMILLMILLSVYLINDVVYLSENFGTPKQGGFYSNTIHQGVAALVASIVIVIFLISFFFRGTLNFVSNSSTKVIATIWLFMNVILVTTTTFKNFDYVMQLGLTYLRLGVFLSLFICFVILVFGLFKLYNQRSFWYLLRRIPYAIIISLVIFSSVNWNKIITHYNLEIAKNDNPDLYYLLSLGPDSYPELMQYHLDNEMQESAFFLSLVNSIEYYQIRSSYSISLQSWRSFNYRDFSLNRDLNKFHIEHQNQSEEMYNEYRSSL